MRLGTFFYAIWCLGVIALFGLGGIYAYSPFADGGRTGRPSGYYGPTHK
jgi:hypothetical protein